MSRSLKVKRQEKREAAEVRQAERAKRTNAQQLALLSTRPGESKKERARLSKV